MRIAQSNHIAAHDYDEKSGTLIIQFVNGAMYAYAGVTPSEYYAFAQSPSPGTYFWDKIRDAKTASLIVGGDKR